MVTALFVTFAVLLILGAPVGIALGGASAVYLVGSDIDLAVVPQFMYAGMDSFVLLCIPGFVLAGNLMNGGGITDQIVLFSNRLVGHIRGGLGLANVTGSMVFAGISGTAVAETASIGAVMFFTGLVIGALYHKLVEEKELSERFGQDYEEYIKKTPFLIPKLWK